MECSSKLKDQTVIVISVINYCVSKGIPIELGVIVKITGAVLGNCKDITENDLCDFCKYALNLFYTFAVVLDTKY